MSVEEKATKFINAYGFCLGAGEVELKSKLIKLLKEQDRDTRHACAETVLSIDCTFGSDAISINKAHNVIMNCRGGVE